MANPYKSGFISIIGKPNVGKSTLMNALVGERLSIVSSKAQTTRHRILGTLNGEHEGTPYQIVYSDTPGVLMPKYELHKSMMQFVKSSLEDADVALLMVDVRDNLEEVRQQLIEYNLIAEEYGGETLFVNVSAKSGTGVNDLNRCNFAYGRCGDRSSRSCRR